VAVAADSVAVAADSAVVVRPVTGEQVCRARCGRGVR